MTVLFSEAVLVLFGSVLVWVLLLNSRPVIAATRKEFVA